MTDSPTSQAMHLAMTELREREQRIAELEDVLMFYADALNYEESSVLSRNGFFATGPIPVEQDKGKRARSVLNKETNRPTPAAAFDFCWLVELRPAFEGHPYFAATYYAGWSESGGDAVKTFDPMAAARFARKEDAERVASNLLHTLSCVWTAVEHGFHRAENDRA